MDYSDLELFLLKVSISFSSLNLYFFIYSNNQLTVEQSKTGERWWEQLVVSVSRVKVGSREREREGDQSRWRLSRSPHYCTSQLSPARLPTGWPRILLLCVVGSSECVNVVLCVALLLVMCKVIIANCLWDLHHLLLLVSVLCCLWSVEVGQKRKLPDLFKWSRLENTW